jgi:hypothetical protein
MKKIVLVTIGRCPECPYFSYRQSTYSKNRHYKKGYPYCNLLRIKASESIVNGKCQLIEAKDETQQCYDFFKDRMTVNNAKTI